MTRQQAAIVQVLKRSGDWMHASAIRDAIGSRGTVTSIYTQIGFIRAAGADIESEPNPAGRGYKWNGMMDITLPWPPATMSGHVKGNWSSKAGLVKKHRQWARDATLAAKWKAPDGDGDIRLLICFYPPDRRSDRVRMPVRVQAQIDGLADAMGINDRRFLPTWLYAEPSKDPCVVYSIEEIYEEPLLRLRQGSAALE